MARRALDADVLRARWTTLADAQGRARAAILAATAALVGAAWEQIGDPYNPNDVRRYSARAATAVRAGRTRTNDLTGAHLRRALDAAQVTPGRGNPKTAPNPRGITLEQEMLRVPAQYRWEISQGADAASADRAARLRAEILADTDLALAARDAARQVFEPVPQVVGYRRVLHPELSRGGVCGLCIAAATRVYRKSDLLPLHGRCHCDSLPVLEGQEDHAQRINDTDLDDLYRRIGLTRREALTQVRVQVVEHGELGPQLRIEGHHFRAPDEVRDDAGDGTPLGEGPGGGDSAVPGPRAPSTAPSGAGGDEPPQAPPAPAGAADGPILPRGPASAGLPDRAEVGGRPKITVTAEALEGDGRIQPGWEGFSDDERRIAQWLLDRGVETRAVRPDDATYSPDAVVVGAGATVEFKTVVGRGFEYAIRKGRRQSPRIVIDARGTDLDETAATLALAAALRRRGAGLEEVLVIGRGFDLSWP